MKRVVKGFFSNQSKNSSSYKFGFLKSILDNLYNVDSELVLTFDQLFGKFTEIYWNLILKYHIKIINNLEDKSEFLFEVQKSNPACLLLYIPMILAIIFV